MVDLLGLKSKLDEVERQIEQKLLENQALEEQIRANKIEIERQKQVADSCRTLIAYESGQMFSLSTAIQNSVEADERRPADMLRLPFQGVRQNEVILSILRSDPSRKFQVDEIIKIAYEPKNEEEFKRVKNSVAASLSRGLIKKLWKGHKGRYYLEESEDVNWLAK
jgi:hypothetical protein